MSEASKEVIRQAVARLEAIGESIKRQASESGEVVRHAVEEVKALETLMKVGASETFLGSSLMMVGVTQWPLSKSAMDEKYASPRSHDQRTAGRRISRRSQGCEKFGRSIQGDSASLQGGLAAQKPNDANAQLSDKVSYGRDKWR